MSPSQRQPLIFIWHHPDDHEQVKKLAQILEGQGFELRYNEYSLQTGEFSFSTVDWWLSQSGVVVFVLSGSAISKPELQEDVKKVLRKDRRMIIPVILDDVAAKNLPALLKFIPSLDFRHQDEDFAEKLIGEIHIKIHEQETKSAPLVSLLTQPHRWVIEHIRTYMTKHPLTFCWQITVENLIVSLTVTGLIQFLFQPSLRTNLNAISATSFLWMVVVVSPIVETILLQAIPVFVAKRAGLKFLGQIFFSVVPFALLHFTRSVGTGVGAGIIGGFYSAFTYVHWRENSLWTAFWVTALSHGLYNFALFAMLIGEF